MTLSVGVYDTGVLDGALEVFGVVGEGTVDPPPASPPPPLGSDFTTGEEAAAAVVVGASPAAVTEPDVETSFVQEVFGVSMTDDTFPRVSVMGGFGEGVAPPLLIRAVGFWVCGVEGFGEGS